MRSGCVRESWRVGVREAECGEWMGVCVGESVIKKDIRTGRSIDRQTDR